MAWQMVLPKVSVCVITYNHEKYIRRCLQSIADQQTTFDIEVIVGEDCSTDGTRGIALEFQKRYPMMFKVILRAKNIGGCDNYRAVHSVASGEYIAHLDGDDYWHDGKLQAQIDFMVLHPNCSAIYTNAWVKSDSGETLGVFSSGVKTVFDFAYLVRKGNFLTSSSMVYRSAYRGFAIPHSGAFVDFRVHIRLALCGNLAFLDKNLVSYTHKSHTSIIQRENDKIRALVWDALKDSNVPRYKRHTIEKAKLYFVADAIVFELIHGNRQTIPKWIFELSKDLEKGTSLTGILVMYWTAVVLTEKALNRLYQMLRKDKTKFVFFKR
jgi:glycosyltransferase involved in cell wall biosynthesis